MAMKPNGHTGVTVVTEVRKLKARNTLNSFVKHSPSHIVAVRKVRSRVNGLRRTMSPSGQIKTRPAAYPAWEHVGMREARSWETPK